MTNNADFPVDWALANDSPTAAPHPVVSIGPLHVVLVECGGGEILRMYLASHGIAANVAPGEEGPFERVEIAARFDADSVRAIVEEWERSTNTPTTFREIADAD
jgi:hypothetical protein